MRLSVYVPCYNGARWIAECLDALLAQTRPFDELLVVDDGSTDESAAIVAGYHPRVRLLRHPLNRGLAVARNTALATATGEIVASVDADVRVTPTWMARLLDGFHSPGVVAVGGRLLEAHQERLPDRWRAAHMAQHAGEFPLRNPPVLPGADVAVRPEVVRALGGYDESFRTNYEDADLQHRLQALGYVCRYEPGAVAQHLRTDTAGSVLRTYWGWLRPPFERQGAFLDGAGLERKARANTDFATRALWRDTANEDGDLGYLSLLVPLAFSGADFAHAALRAMERGEGDTAAGLADAAARWAVRAPEALRTRSPALAALLADDLARVAWWDAGGGPVSRREGDSPAIPPQHSADAGSAASSTGESRIAERVLETVRRQLEAWPRAWWPRIEAARRRLAEDQGWPAVSGAAAGGPARRSGGGPRAQATAEAGGEGDSGFGTAPGAARWLAREAGADAQAVILHGAHGRGEQGSGSPPELLLVLRRALPEDRVERLRAGLRARLGLDFAPSRWRDREDAIGPTWDTERRRRGSDVAPSRWRDREDAIGPTWDTKRRLNGSPATLEVIEAHRLGWLGPSIFQQSLLAGAVVLWGDAAVLGIVPGWPPEALPPRLALDEARGAVADLAAGGAGERRAAAVMRAAGALLIARRAYTPRWDARRGALLRVWPEAPRPDAVAPEEFARQALALVEGWLFTWEGDAPNQAVVDRYRALRSAAEGALSSAARTVEAGAMRAR